MTTTSVRSGSRRAAGALSSGSLALLALAVVPLPAGAVSPEISYSCPATEGVPAFVLPVVLDTSLPQRMTTGQATQVVMTATATLPGKTAQEIATTYSATTLEVTLTPQVAFGAAPAVSPVFKVPPAPISDQTSTSSLKLTASSPAFAYSAPSAPGPLEITAGNVSVELRPNGSDPQKTVQLTCTVPNGKAPVVDTVSVASPTTTTLTISRSTAAYGQDVSASATVTSPSGVPSGEVAFTVDGTVTRARVGKDGVASLVLPDRAIGTHTVTATFVPADALMYVGGTSVTKLLTVSKAETLLKIPVTGRTTTTVTRLGVKAKGRYDTVPTGKVRIKVKRLGKPGKWARNRTLSAAGTARIGLGILAAGRYRAVVVYKGDTNHLEARKIKTFRVKKR
jgi:Bacterial Ig-like domain (group 3)